MHVLRIRLSRSGEGGHLVAVDHNPGRGMTGFTSAVPFLFPFGSRERRRLRSYLEELPLYPDAASRAAAAGIAAELRARGEAMLQLLLRDRRARWHFEQATRDLHRLRVEVLGEHPSAGAIPWELLRDPELGWLAAEAKSFVRLPVETRRRAAVPPPAPGPLRILYVEVGGRPGAVSGQPVVRPLVHAFVGHRERLCFDVLRPPTFAALARALAAAAAAGRPYHVLHCDGGGVGAGEEGGRARLLFAGSDDSQDAAGERPRPAGGAALGALLAGARTPLLVLTASRAAGEAPDRVFSALAHRAVSAGAGAVLTLPWAAGAEAAAGFLIGFYERLANGAAVGEATATARAGLRHRPRRGPAAAPEAVDPIGAEAWLAAAVWEAAPLRLVARPEERLWIQPAEPDGAPALLGSLPPPPAWGFVDRGAISLAVDRALGSCGAVLLYAPDGAGKTALAREIALWWEESGGLEPQGAILWSSFAPGLPFDPFGVLGLQIADPADRRRAALRVLAEVPALWIWDDVDALPAAARPLLAALLRDLAATTRCKVLLTSRGEETWLDGPLQRLPVPPLDLAQRLDLAARLVRHRGRDLADVPDLRPALRGLAAGTATPRGVLDTVERALAGTAAADG